MKFGLLLVKTLLQDSELVRNVAIKVYLLEKRLVVVNFNLTMSKG